MGKKSVRIDEEACIGCGICAEVCEQSAIEMIDGIAKVTREDYCDGIGNCLPACPVNAITFLDVNSNENSITNLPHSCSENGFKETNSQSDTSCFLKCEAKSELKQWPVQIKLVLENAPYFNGCDLLIAADCTAYAYASFHSCLMKNRITIIGCPKLDMCDYTEKLTKIISSNDIKSVTAVRMEVPCCGGIELATIKAIKASEKIIPWQVITVSRDGIIIEI